MNGSGQRRARVNRMRAQNHQIRGLVKRLKELRENAGLTQEEFADLIGRNQSSVSRFESFDSYPRLDIVRDYVVALGYEVQFDLQPTHPKGSYTYTQRKGAENASVHGVRPMLSSPTPLPAL